MAAVRYLDILLVLMALPIVVIARLPLLGYGVAAGAWIAQRVAAVLIEQRAKKEEEVRATLAIQFAGMLVRVFLIAGAIITVGRAGSDDDGVMAASLALVAFSVYLL